MYFGYSIYHKEPASIVQDIKPAPEKRQEDGSLVLKKTPQINVQPKHILPPSTKLKRAVSAVIQPNNTDCPPINVDMSIVENSKGEQRAVISSPDGTVVSGSDTPVINLNLKAPKELKWAAGASYNSDRKYGVWIDRDVGLFRIGAEIVKTNEDTLYIVKAGIRF